MSNDADLKGEVAGSFLLGLVGSFCNLNIIPQGGLMFDVDEIAPDHWYPYSMLMDALGAIERAFPGAKGNIFFRAGTHFIRVWYEDGPGKTMIHSGMDWLRANQESGGYNSVVRGGTPEEVGWSRLLSLDEAAGVAVQENVMPLLPDYIKGVFYGGCILFDDMDYVDVEETHEQYLPNPAFTRTIITIRYRLRNTAASAALDRKLDQFGSDAGPALTETETQSLLWRCKGLAAQIRLDNAYYNDINPILADTVREKERTLATLMENLPGMAFRCKNDQNWTMEFVNQGCLDLCGYLPEELLNNKGAAYGDLIHPEDRERVWTSYQEKLRVRERATLEYRISCKDGTEKWVWEQGQGVYSPSGEVEAIAGFISDITERKRMERTLRTETENLEAVFSASPLAMMLLDESTSIVRVNEAGIDFCGGDASEILHRRPGDVLKCAQSTKSKSGCGHGPECPFCPVRRGIEGLIANGGSIHGAEAPLTLLRNGKPEEISLAAYARSVSIDGRTHVVVALDDITERKQTGEALRSTAERYQMAQVMGRVGHWSYEPSTQKFEGSPEALRIYGFDPDAMVSLEEVMSCIAPSDAEQTLSALMNCVQNGTTFDQEIRLHPRGSTEPTIIWSRADRIIDDHGTPSVLGVLQDITEHKHAEEEITTLNAELEQRVRDRTAELEAAIRELDAFSYSVSHDLRAPLRSIDGFGLALLEDCEDRLDADGKDYLATIRAATQRMGTLIDDMLRLSRLTRTEMHIEKINLTEIARSIIQELQTSEPERIVNIQIADGLEDTADPKLMRIALENLLGNAWKFTRKRAKAKIELGSTDEGGHRTYYVRDNGAGFDMAYVNKLFTPFQRLHSVEEYPGTGIGLGTVQRIMNRHGGKVWAEGQVDHGATIYFSFHN